MLTNKKKCKVCGDKANGFNYTALSCRSCKVFFQRYQSMNFKCVKEDCCTLDTTTRSCCKKCRLDKCFAIGMQQTKQTNNAILPPQISSLRSLLEVNVDNFDLTKEMTNFLVKQKRTSPFALTPQEYELISHTSCAIDSAFENEKNQQIIGEYSDIQTIINMSWSEIYARRIVHFCKNMFAFKSMKPDDQLIVLRSFVMDILSVWNAFLWDADTGSTLMAVNNSGTQSSVVRFIMSVNDNSSPVGTLKCNENFNFLTNLNVVMENDYTIRNLVIAQLLFYPSQDSVSCPEFIKYQYFVYSYLLKRYLMHKYRNTQKAKHKFTLLTDKLNKLTLIKEISKICLFETCADRVPELFLEIFN